MDFSGASLDAPLTAIVSGVLVPGLRTVRRSRALSQETLAERAGVDRKTVARGERGLEIRLSSVYRLAKALRVSPQRLQERPPASPK